MISAGVQAQHRSRTKLLIYVTHLQNACHLRNHCATHARPVFARYLRAIPATRVVRNDVEGRHTTEDKRKITWKSTCSAANLRSAYTLSSSVSGFEICIVAGVVNRRDARVDLLVLIGRVFAGWFESLTPGSGVVGTACTAPPPRTFLETMIVFRFGSPRKLRVNFDVSEAGQADTIRVRQDYGSSKSSSSVCVSM